MFPNINISFPLSTSPLSVLSSESRLFWLFTKRDLIVTVVPCSLFMLVSLSTLSQPLAYISNFLLGLVYFALFIYQFTVSNQIHGLEEDKIDKPDRPIPSGLVSLDEANVRYVVLVLAYLTLGTLLNVFWWTILWVLVTYFHNVQGWDKKWATKNILAMGLGVLSMLGAAWCIIGNLTITSYTWIIAIALWIGFTSAIQDFRDQEGDALNGRKTLPLLVGDVKARKIMIAIYAVVMVFIINVFIFLSTSAPVITYAICALLAIWHIVMMVRLWKLRTPAADKTTYNALCLLYCVLLLSSFCIF
ncbi:MAG: UbiA family prenyltransferase [Aureispira sp.]